MQAQGDSTHQATTLSELSLEELMNVKVITASGSAQSIGEAPSTMMVITAKQIAERGYEELDDALRDIPGLDLIHTSGTYPVIRTFRGMFGDENKRFLLMIDGIIENNINGGFDMGGPVYSLHNVDRIEIIWGPASALYGANAFGGVINMITKKAADINGLKFDKGQGSYNTSFEKLWLGANKNKIDISFSALRYNTDGPRFTNRNPNYANSYVDNASAFYGIIGYTIKNFKTTLGFRAFNSPAGLGTFINSPTKRLGLPSQGYENTGDVGALQSNVRGEKPSLREPYSRTIFLQNEYTPNGKFSLLTRLQYHETGLSVKTYVYTSTSVNRPFTRLILAHHSNVISGEANANYQLAANHKLSGGVQFSQLNMERGYRETNPDTKIDTIENIAFTNLRATFKPRSFTIQNNVGTYLQYELNTDWLRKTNFTLGSRLDNNSMFGSTINPRLSIVNRPSDNLTFKLIAGTAYRAPTNFELYAKASSRLANPDLKPEKIRTYEANIIFSPSKIYLIQVNAFRNELTNIIVDGVPVGSGGFIQNENAGSATINGAEARVDAFFSKQISGFINFTYQDGKQINGTKEFNIPNIATVKGTIGFSAHLEELLNISLIGNWVGDRPVPSTNPLGKVTGYFIPNLVISTNKLFDNRVTASLNIRNLFNQTYVDPGIRAADGNFYSTAMEQPGINGLFKISVSLF